MTNNKKSLIILLFCLVSFGVINGAVFTNLLSPSSTQPYKMANYAQFELIASSPNLLTNVVQITPQGDIQRIKLVKTNNVFDALRIKFPINYFSWTPFSLRFTPQTNGEITIVLSGPYEENTNKIPYTQMNLWDNIEISGAELTNGDFEEVNGNQPIGWLLKGGVANSGPIPAYKGRYYGRTSFNKTIETTFAVKSGSNITINLFARSMPSIAEKVMRRILSKNTTAHTTAKKFARGVNLTHYLELNPEKVGQMPYPQTDFKLIKSEGFDHIRIPIAFQYYIADSNYNLNPIIFDKIEVLITNAFLNNLNVILCWSGFEEFYSKPTECTNLLFQVWRQISDFYNLYPENLAFELIDSPPSSLNAPSLNTIYQNTINIIREKNPEKTIFLSPPESSVNYLSYLNLPYEDDNIIVSVKVFDPVYFTHQGINFNGLDLKELIGIVFPGPPQKPFVLKNPDNLPEAVKDWILKYNKFPSDINPCSNRSFEYYLNIARQWSEYLGRPIYVSGFGASSYADSESRSKYYFQFRKYLNEANIGWSIYDWKFEFKYIDSARNQPLPGMHEALFEK